MPGINWTATSQSEVRHFNALAVGDSLQIEGGSLSAQILWEKGRPQPTTFGVTKLESLGYRMVKKCRKFQPAE